MRNGSACCRKVTTRIRVFYVKMALNDASYHYTVFDIPVVDLSQYREWFFACCGSWIKLPARFIISSSVSFLENNVTVRVSVKVYFPRDNFELQFYSAETFYSLCENPEENTAHSILLICMLFRVICLFVCQCGYRFELNVIGNLY